MVLSEPKERNKDGVENFIGTQIQKDQENESVTWIDTRVRFRSLSKRFVKTKSRKVNKEFIGHT